ncbi:glycoside hydrolase [Tamlana nanhaiensis]|uniref:Glycoside hydrolase n=1 Tax=Neotamlana nanhaiensis TaxID=1382798 RepID=A0A0D7W6P7_9FLAO|nr:glycoside hydrolase family 28 protein [Tamlana nanhaiensis]KJD34724.1 glycoside hydrolase [Tamlana nanhaiensis]
MQSSFKVVIIFLGIIQWSCAQNTTINIQDFGAVSDGKTLNTTIIQNAIDKVHKADGGKVIIPKGNYVTGSIQLKSNVTLFLEEDAILLGSTNPEDYQEMAFPGRPESPKNDDNSQMALIIAHKANNIKLTGKGKIDGQGLKLALAIDSLHHAGIKIDPNYNYRRHRPNETMRPKLFRFSHCENVDVTNLQVGEAACWGLSFELCKNMIIDNIKVVNRSYWNNDGMDITDCQNVKITNCDINAADDGICLKSYYPGYANDGIFISNCTIRSSASAIKFGSASYGGFKNVTIENINVFDTFRSALAFESVDGAIIENINVNNVVAKNTGNAIFIRLGHRDGEKPGIVKNISIKNIKVEVPFGRPDINYELRGPEVNFFHNPFPASIVGIPENYIENVTLENVEITYPGKSFKGMAYVPLSRLDAVPEEIKGYPEFSMFGELPAWALYVRHAKGLNFKNVTVKLKEDDFRPAFVFDDVKTLNMEAVSISKKDTNQIILNNTENINLDATAKKQVLKI